MTWRYFKRGRGGSSGVVVVVVVASLGFGIEAFATADTVTVRCSHCSEVVCRAKRSCAESVVSGKVILRFAETGGFMVSVQVFVVGDTRRRASLDGRLRREKRRCVAGKVGGWVGWWWWWWYSGTRTEIG